jgi:hypothetical protein
VSIYDMMMELGKLPYLPRVQNSALYGLCAKDVMHTQYSCLNLASTLRDAVHLLVPKRSVFEDAASLPQFPLVVSSGDMTFLGSVSRIDLEVLVNKDPVAKEMLTSLRQASDADSSNEGVVCSQQTALHLVSFQLWDVPLCRLSHRSTK